MKLRELAERIGCRLEGDGDIHVDGVASLQDARGGDVSFVANRRYAAQLAGTKASAVIVAPAIEAPPCAALRTDDPYTAFARAVALLSSTSAPPPGVDGSSSIAVDAVLAEGVSIGPLVVV